MCRLFPFPNPSSPLQKCRCPSPPSSLHFSSFFKFPSFSLLLILAFAAFFELAAASGQLHFQLALSPQIPRQIPSTALRRPAPQIRVEICAMEFRWLDPAAAEFEGNEGNGNGPSETAENIAENGNNAQQKDPEGGGENCKFGHARLTIPPHSPSSMSPSPSSISLPFSHSWRQSFAFALRIWQGNDLLVHQLERIHRLPAGAGWLMRSANFSSGKNEEANAQRHKLDIRLRVDCAANFYGPGCDVRCELNDWERRLGRWECSKADGQKQCAPGWTGGPNCSQPKAAASIHSQVPPANANQMENMGAGCECLNGGKCAQVGGGGGCQCPPGYGGDRCQECVKSARCRGHCQRPGECECPQGMGGQFCEKDLIYCTRHQPCQNGGLCLNDAERNYTCQCAAGFGGQNCEVPMRQCGQGPCQNGGKCVPGKADPLAAFNGIHNGDGGGGFYCECPAGIFGRFCQIRAPRGCLGGGTNPCQNGGTCAQTGEFAIGPSLALREIGGQNGGGQIDFKCHCAAGWRGQFCEEQFCPIGANPCQNGALCLLDSTLASGHRCQCPLGWEGPQCGSSVDDCRWAPCMNGAKCLDGHNAFQCQCADGFHGELCQHRWLPFVPDGEKKQPQIMSNLVVTSVEKKLPDAASGFWPTLVHLLLLLLAIIALMALLALVLFLLPSIWPELAQRQFWWQNGQRQSKGNCPAEGDVQISVIADPKRGKWKAEEENAANKKMEEHFEDQPPRYVSDPLEEVYGGSSRFGPGQEAGAYLAKARRQRMGGRILGRNLMEDDFGGNSSVGTLEGNYSMEAEGGGEWAKRRDGGTNGGNGGNCRGGIQGHFGGTIGGDETDSEAGYEQIRYGQMHGIGQQNGQRMPQSTTMPPPPQIHCPRQMPPKMPMASSWRDSQKNCGTNEEGIFVLDQRF